MSQQCPENEDYIDPDYLAVLKDLFSPDFLGLRTTPMHVKGVGARLHPSYTLTGFYAWSLWASYRLAVRLFALRATFLADKMYIRWYETHNTICTIGVFAGADVAIQSRQERTAN